MLKTELKGEIIRPGKVVVTEFSKNFKIDVMISFDFRIKSWDERGEYSPIYNYLKKGIKLMSEFRPRSKDPKSNTDTIYSEKIIKYTVEKPMIMWSERPSHATEFYMPLKMLLENCDSSMSTIVSYIIEK